MNHNIHHVRLALSRQALLRKQPFGTGLAATRRAVEHLGYVQIDTLSVVARAHHHVLWTRVRDYRPADLDTLLAQGHIFEYRTHAAAYLPMRDYRFARLRMAHYQSTRPRSDTAAARLLQRITDEGPLRLRDIVKSAAPNSAERLALEQLFLQGDIMVGAHDGMEKIYDLTERVLPAHADTRLPDRHEYAAWLLDSHLRAHGIVTLSQLLHAQSDKPMKNILRDIIAARVQSGKLMPAPGLADAWLPGEWHLPRKSKAPLLHILSPFDNLIIHRARLRQIFGFDYRLECHLSKNKRQYGYFSLLVLYGEQFVGRLDCKAHRREKRLEILRYHPEAHAPPANTFAAPLWHTLQAFAAFNGCTDIDDGRHLPRPAP